MRFVLKLICDFEVFEPVRALSRADGADGEIEIPTECFFELNKTYINLTSLSFVSHFPREEARRRKDTMLPGKIIDKLKIKH